MTTKDDGGPAFPHQYELTGSPRLQFGMTLRDYFAGQALAGTRLDWAVEGPDAALYAQRAYVMADAMIAARKS